MRTIAKTVYQFSELSDHAKERARDWYRQGNLDYDWYDSVYEDAATIADILGIRLDKKAKNNPHALALPAIFFSGFSSQGDGACFAGQWSFKADCAKAIRAHAPQDQQLHEIADALSGIEYAGGFFADIKHRGRYYHEHSMEIGVQFEDGVYQETLGEDGIELPLDKFTDGETVIIESMREFARWIYRSLEREYEYLNSDETVDENIEANGYEFDEDGRPA